MAFWDSPSLLIFGGMKVQLSKPYTPKQAMLLSPNLE